jgi:glucosamine--fructose-6-phosphate aminotransferase (isomerizing)
METREYLHGPLEAVGPGLGCVVFGGARERDLAAELASFGAAVALLTDAEVADRRPAASGATIELPQVSDLAAPILQILPVQLLVDSLARLRGLEIGKLRRHQPDTKVI